MCARPLLWDVEEAETAGFWMTASATHTFTCGPLEALPTRWFRFTAPKNGPSVEVTGVTPEDDYILEIFEDAACAPAASIGCNDDADGKSPELDDVDITSGKTYWVAVGRKGAPSDQPARIRIDH